MVGLLSMSDQLITEAITYTTNNKQDRQSAYNITLKHFRATIVAVEKQ